MEVRPRHRIRRSRPPPPPHGALPVFDLDVDDRISALHGDMLLLVLVRLRCARTAARTAVLSRRWRGLWSRLPDLTFRYLRPGAIETALSRVALPAAVSLIDIRFPDFPKWGKADDVRAKSLLRATARLSPEELVFTLAWSTAVKPGRPVEITMPCFRRAKSIELDTNFLRLKAPPAGQLPVLERLSLSGNIVDLGTMLSRCPRLRVLSVTFRGTDPDLLQAALASLEASAELGLMVALLNIRYIGTDLRYSVGAPRFASLLGAMARVFPQELVLMDGYHECYDIDLPCFRRTTAIQMSLYTVRFTKLPVDQFPALERLSLTGCTVPDLATLVTRCPRLRVLKATIDSHTDKVTAYSTSLQELYIDAAKDTECRVIDIVTPLLKRLNLEVKAGMDLSMSISTPMVEKVSLTRSYTQSPLLFGFWSLNSMRLETTESHRYYIDGGLSNINDSQPPRIHALVLSIFTDVRLLSVLLLSPLDLSAILGEHIYLKNNFHSGAVPLNFEHEMKKLLITNFTALELYLNIKGHVLGALMLRLLGMQHIRTAIQRLKVILPGWGRISQTSKCLENCLCNEPKNWSNQSISLAHLEEVEIDNFIAGDSEIGIITMILRWAPVLKRMTIKLAYDIKQSDTEGCVMNIGNICLVRPSVDCFVYLSYGELVWRTPIKLPCFS